MADIGKIYSNAIGGKQEPFNIIGESLAEAAAEQQLHLQTKIDWLKSARTQEVFTDLRGEITKLEVDARNLAVTFHSHNNHQHIIKLLIEASTLRSFIDKYGHAE